MLGGGHGWLQGRHGLMADNLISARVVLANGTAVTVSGIEHEDLFWALRGAGHNFGIVTSFEYKVYDRTPENEKWTYEMMIFSEDKLEELYALANTMISSPENSQPVELVHWSMMMRMPDFDAQKVCQLLQPTTNHAIANLATANNSFLPDVPRHLNPPRIP